MVDGGQVTVSDPQAESAAVDAVEDGGGSSNTGNDASIASPIGSSSSSATQEMVGDGDQQMDSSSSPTHSISNNNINSGNSNNSQSGLHSSASSTDSQGSSSSASSREPDPDAIKMFVGQIPRDWGEGECRKLFSTYGDIYSLNVLRDKTTGVSRGCCFVTFFTRKSALDAQNALHNITTLEGMHHPIQMKPADSENRNERKLFVGMLAKKYTENDVRLMFAPFGNIEECTVLRDANGVSKGCAFVTFATRQCAVNAIKHMNHSQTMEGCSSPLVVKFADTQKDKDARRQQQILMQQLAAATVATQQHPTNQSTASAAAAAGVSAATLAAAANLSNPYLALAAAAAANVVQQQQQHHHQQQQQAVQAQAAQQQQHLAATALALQQQLASSTDPLTIAATAALASNPMLLAQLCGVGPSTATATAASHVSGSTGASTPSTASHLNGGTDLYGPPHPQGSGPNAAGAANGHHHPGAPPTGGPFGGPLSAFSTAQQAASLAHQLAAVTGQGQHSHTHSQPPHHQGLHPAGPPPPHHHPSTLHHTVGHHQSQGPPSISPGGPHHPHHGTNGNGVGGAAGANGQGIGGAKQMEGPDGANLFIYHLPAEFTDPDLAQAFSPFGHVLSSKVFIDKQTNLSKCFGFVSYDNPLSAQAAIQSMNGFQIGTKRLKVQLKRSKDKPY